MKNELSKRVLLMHILLLLALCGVLLRVLWVSRGEQYQRAAAAQKQLHPFSRNDTRKYL